MVKRRTFKRSVKTAVSKAISQYQRRKINYVMNVMWDTDGNLFIDGQQQNAFIIGECLKGNVNEFQTLGKQYAQVKLRGIRIEAVCSLVGQNALGYNMGLCLAHANDSIVFDNLRTQPNVMLFSQNSASKMYYKVNGEFSSTNSIELFNNLSIIPFRQGTGFYRFTVKITCYLTFKSSV